jgi:protein SFI1
MGEDKRNVNLFTKFQSLCRKLGADVDIVPDEDGGVGDITRNTQEMEYTDGTRDIGPRYIGGRMNDVPLELPKRSSIKTVLNRIAEVDSGILENSSPYDITEQNQQPSRAQSRPRPSSMPRGRTGARAISEQFAVYRKRDASTSSRGSLKISRRPSSVSGIISMDTTDDEGSDIVSMDERNYIPPESSPEILWKHSETELLDWADTFQHTKAIRVARKALTHWNEEAQDLRQLAVDMEEIAIQHDHKTLLRSGFETWRSRTRDKRSAKETEYFFQQLESRASRARDLFLLTKSFTHWAQYASDEVLRTSVARRHILRTRYFNAWRDITAVNDTKVRRFVLRKFLSTWRYKTFCLVEQERMAVNTYDYNLVARTYWNWFWSFCNRRAPLWGENRAKRIFFLRWHDITRQLKVRADWVQKMYEHDLQRNSLSKWHHKFSHIEGSSMIATEHLKKTTMKKTLCRLRKEASLQPIAKKISRNRDVITVRGVFQTWKMRTDRYRQATLIDRRRLLTLGLKHWNDKLRCREISSNIDERLLVETLYKWVLASRAALFERVQEGTRKRKAFSTWLAMTRTLRDRNSTAQQSFQDAQRKIKLQAVLSHWRTKSEERRNNARVAFANYQRRLLLTTYGAIVHKYDEIQRLNQWSSHAQNYVYMRKAINLWHQATHQARKERRRQNYIHVRTQNKLRLVRRCLHTWTTATFRFNFLDRQATEAQENRILKLSQTCLRDWRVKVETFKTQKLQAERRFYQALLSQSFGVWESRYAEVITLNKMVAPFEASINASATSKALKGLNWKLFQIENQKKTAIALEEKHFEKHVRLLLRYLADQASRRRSTHSNPDAISSQPLRRENINIEGFSRENQRMHQPQVTFEESAFDIGNMNLNQEPFPQSEFDTGAAMERADMDIEQSGFMASTPLPAYLRTPSKRTIVRSKARERVLGMTAGAGGRINTPKAPPANLTSASYRPSSTPASVAVPVQGSVPLETEGPISVARQGAATAPPASQQLSRISAGEPITPFARKLKAQGYQNTRFGHFSPIQETSTPQMAFTGFDDIMENLGTGKNKSGKDEQ